MTKLLYVYILLFEMDIIASVKNNNNEDKIQMIFEMLKQQIDEYNIISKKNKISRTELRKEKIQKLVTEEKHLSTEFQKIKKELKRYEKKYEKALKKKVKLLKIQIEEDRRKLEATKQKYYKLETYVNIAEKIKSKKKSKPLKVKMMLPKFIQKNLPLSKKIKIKIKKNEKLVKIIKPTMNTRECKIVLQRLTEEQMNKYISQNRLSQERITKKRITRDSLKKNNENEISTIYPRWHIKIPKSVFQESLLRINNFNLNSTSISKDVI
ncbi:protein PFC0760c-like isoform X1 [Apis mellifera]|uniref:Protein PFC0760c-like isoform X1 n=1 Tax=Apis mellifera TaxID=7460 RepID=A0A7M7MNZ8_APIME|nr:protein PFC0760c-like isoform X1 [Apis mellifera]|eukprot:XP_026298819.1 protein PFC0760c-like isoform X1 [Apis mellifera]